MAAIAHTTIDIAALPPCAKPPSPDQRIEMVTKAAFDTAEKVPLLEKPQTGAMTRKEGPTFHIAQATFQMVPASTGASSATQWVIKRTIGNNIYSGGFSDKPDGLGKMHYSDNYRLGGIVYYEGSFKEGFREGAGFARWSDGTSYQGNWLSGMRHGSGTFINSTAQFIGDWFEGNLTKGTIIYSSGVVYMGEISNLLPHGKGIKLGPDFSYEGHFNEGLYQGKGTLKVFGAGKSEGVWRKGEKHGAHQFQPTQPSASFTKFYHQGKDITVFTTKCYNCCVRFWCC